MSRNNILLFFLGFLFLFPALTQAKAGALTPGQCNKLGLACSGSINDLGISIAGFVDMALGLLGLVAVIFIMYGGLQYIIARGEEKEYEKAKHTILYAMLGLIIVGLAAVIVNFVMQAFQ